MMTKIWLGAAALGTAAGAAMSGQVYLNDADFMAAAGPVHTNSFSSVALGYTPSVSTATADFAYDISATNGLFNAFGVISTSAANDALTINFTSGNVMAVGGQFWGTNALFIPVTTDIRIELSDGTVVEFTTLGREFRGFMSDVAITSMTIQADRTFLPQYLDAYATMDNLTVGTLVVVPLPPAAWAGLGMLGLIGGVRAVRRRG